MITLATLVRDVPIRSWTLFTLAAVTLILDTVDGAVGPPGVCPGQNTFTPAAVLRLDYLPWFTA